MTKDERKIIEAIVYLMERKAINNESIMYRLNKILEGI